ncbi:hypothetical protein H4R19_001797 [Coemansia spiralis]|nr:hypothetical protein H4R19_001797 [Coemansia spiralis]
MSPTYTLRYFSTSGLAEASRLLLTAANVEWSEEHPEWPAEKANQPFGRLPVLIEKSADGGADFVITESSTIERYLARQHGFLPADLKQAALQEQVRDRLLDVMVTFHTRSSIIADRLEEKKKAFEDMLARFLGIHTETLKQNGNSGYLFGDSFSYADAVSYQFFKHFFFGAAISQADIADHIKAKLTPEIVKHLVTIEADPALAAHMAKADTVTDLLV